MTLQKYKKWQKTTLKECIRTGVYEPFDLVQVQGYCHYGESKSRVCDYHTCPRRCYYKTDGMCTVKRTDNQTTVTFFDDMVKVTLTPERVAFLARALSEVSDAQKGGKL